MIYLFSQIAISLALAAIVGAVAGWLAHRARAGKLIDRLESSITRQVQQVNEAQTQVSMLTHDFDDLKQHSESEISALTQDNQKIPALAQNLEKSQLLVNQLMQQHKAEKIELLSENEKLVSKTKQVADREQAFTKLQAELDIERRRNQQLNAKTETASHSKANGVSADAQSELELPLDNKAETDSDSKVTKQSAEKNKTKQPVANGVDNAPDAQVNKSNGVANASKLDDKPILATDKNAAIKDSDSSSAAETEAELRLLRDQLAEDLPPKQTAKESSRRVHKLTETTVDEDHLEPLFETVTQHDDLKQIFGIGPVTEKTLNKLGITAYSQLAELKQHDIEKIAGALQIFPGRIERDNWVGGARAQLEEMLEDL